MSQRNRQAPTDWDAYQRGRAPSSGSLDNLPEDQQQIQFSSSVAPTSLAPNNNEQDLRHRRSSVAVRFTSLRQMNAPNSIDNFAKSLQRAAGYYEVTPVRRGSIVVQDDEGHQPDNASTAGPTPPMKSLLRQQFEAAGGYNVDTSAIQDAGEPSQPTEQSSLLGTSFLQPVPSHAASFRPSIAPSDFGQSYGSISSRLTVKAQRRASILIQQQREANIRALEDEDEEHKDVFIPTHVEQELRPDGEVIERLCGESTVPMTIFNSTNVLVGVGILALPLALHYAGWVPGLIILTLAAVGTSYTARLLVSCMDSNSGCMTYGDIAFLAFGTVGRNVVELLFVLELVAGNVALIIIFADSMHSLLPTFISKLAWKTIIAVGLMPTNITPLKYLGFGSVLGIMSCIGILLILVTDGIIKPHRPGSLHKFATTHAFPQNWTTLPLSMGLLMALWSGQSVFPSIYRDMRHPQKFGRTLNWTYSITFTIDFFAGVVGYLMFGDGVAPEVSINLVRGKAYPHVLSVLVVMLVALIPISKITLQNRPVIDTINKQFSIDLRQMEPKARKASEQNWKHRLGRAGMGVSVNLVELAISVFLPDFDSVMALLGSAFCFTICTILPLLFYLRIFNKGISLRERIICYLALAFCAILALIGTVFAIIPKERLGIKNV